MAQDQLCKFCEDSEDPERGVLLICDLTGSGELPFAIGINCLPDWLTTMLEAIAILDEVIVVAHEKAEAIDAVFAEPEDPTAILEPSGPSPVESSAPDTGNGSGKTLSKSRTAATKTTE